MDQQITQKLFVVYISSGETTEVFRAVEDIPETLREKLVRAARNSHIDTLVIANEKGREMLEAKGGLPKPEEEPPAVHPLSKNLRWAIGCMLAGGAGLAILAVYVITH